MLKFGYSEKATKFKKIFHLEFDVTEWHQILSGRFFQIFWPPQNIRTLTSVIIWSKKICRYKRANVIYKPDGH